MVKFSISLFYASTYIFTHEQFHAWNIDRHLIGTIIQPLDMQFVCCVLPTNIHENRIHVTSKRKIDANAMRSKNQGQDFPSKRTSKINHATSSSYTACQFAICENIFAVAW